MKFTHEEKMDFVRGLIYSRDTWLDSFGGTKYKFPQSLIDEKRKELEVMREIHQDYKRAVERTK